MSQQMNFALAWATQDRPKRPHGHILSFDELGNKNWIPRPDTGRGSGHVATGVGTTFDLFSWLDEVPTPPRIIEDGHQGFDEAEQAYLREMVLWDAIKSLMDGKCGRQFEENIEWILDDSIHPFSFRVCSAERGIDPDDLRAEVLCHVTRYLGAKRKKSAAELAFLQDQVLQRHLDALFTCPDGTAGFTASATWLSNDSELDPLSFRACCKATGVNPDAIRQQVVAHRKRRWGSQRKAA